MKYIEMNPAALFKKSGDSMVLYSGNGDISIELDSFSSFVFELIEKYNTVDELTDFLFEHREEYDCAEMSKDDFSMEIGHFIIDLIKQGILKSLRIALVQPYVVAPNGKGYSLYFPHLRKVAVVDATMFAKLKAITINRYQEIERLPDVDETVRNFAETFNEPIALDEAATYHHERSRRLVLLPTTACNLKCQYCYAWRSGKQILMMTKEIAEAGIEYTVANAMESGVQSVDISFMGGGEPTCNWSVLQHSVEYAHRTAKLLGTNTPCSVTLTTNGVLDAEKATWIGKNIDNIKISFDGVKEVQDIQRPAKVGSSFEIASRTMKILSDLGANFLVRITVTNDSLDKLESSVRYLVDNFTPNSIIINPVYVCGSCASHGVSSIDHEAVVKAFERIQNLGVNKNIDIVTPYDKVTYMDVPRLPFCGFQKGNCFLTPDGYVSACSEIDAIDDNRSTVLFFGSWNSVTKELYVNEEKEAQLHELSVVSNARCEACNNNIFCPGPCLVRRLNSDTIQRISEMRRHKKPEESFSDEEMLLLMSSEHSEESLIQCAMTRQLTSIQINRVANCPELVNELSVQAQIIPSNFAGVRKIVALKCK